MLHVVRFSLVLLFIVSVIPAFGVPVVTGLSPTRQVLTSGQGTTLSVTAVGSGPLSYQWRRNGRPINGATANSFALTGSSSENGWYDAAISDSDGSTRSPVIFVTVAPTTSRMRTWSYSSIWLTNSGQGDVPADLNTAIATSVGTLHAVALKRNGTVVGWTNDYHTLSSLAPSDGLADVVAVAAGQRYTAALKSDGTLAQWGHGQIHAPAGLTGVVAIVVSNVHGLALKADGTVVAWGNDAEGQSTVPAGLSNVVAIACNSYHSHITRWH